MVTLPFWLPTGLGGYMSYHFVITDSMKETLDPGAFVVMRRSDDYRVGDVVAYLLDPENEDTVTILHRIVGRQPDGQYLLKGDAVDVIEEVEESAITGKMVQALPALGFLPNAFRHAPLLFGGMLLILVFLVGDLFKKKPAHDDKPRQRPTHLFLPAVALVLFSLSFATVGLGESIPLPNVWVQKMLTGVPLSYLLIGLVGLSRMAEVAWASPRGSPVSSSIVELNYMAVMILAVSLIPVGEIWESSRILFTF